MDQCFDHVVCPVHIGETRLEHQDLLIVRYAGHRRQLAFCSLKTDNSCATLFGSALKTRIERFEAGCHLQALAIGNRQQHGDQPGLQHNGGFARHAGLGDERLNLFEFIRRQLPLQGRAISVGKEFWHLCQCFNHRRIGSVSDL